MSYARTDDEDGWLTELRERLSQAVGRHTGEEFTIFQDRNDIKWGENWKERIEQSIDSATFFIPVITPRFFTSRACRRELKRFLSRESALGRNDLVLPIYHVTCLQLDDPRKLSRSKFAQAIAKHQYADWRALRTAGIRSAKVRKAFDELAIQVRDALGHPSPGPVKPAARERGHRSKRRIGSGAQRHAKRSVSSRQDTERIEELRRFVALVEAHTTARGTAKQPVRRRPDSMDTVSSIAQSASDRNSVESATTKRTKNTRESATKSKPRTWVVDAKNRGTHTTIKAALEAASPGDYILVRPGVYQGGLVIDKTVEIIGEGDVDKIIVLAKGKSVIVIKATEGRIVNLTLRQMGGLFHYGVSIEQGRLQLEGCDISSQSLDCVSVGYRTEALLQHNRIHDGATYGVSIGSHSPVTLEDNDIFANAFDGVKIRGSGNRILRRNRIQNNKHAGVLIEKNGRGLLMENDILKNGRAGVEIKKGGNPTLQRNRINGNGYEAVRVNRGGGGTFDNNNLCGNARGAWNIAEDSAKDVKSSGNLEA